MAIERKFNVVSFVGALVGSVLFLLTLGLFPGQGVQGYIATSSAVQIPQALILAFEGLLFGLLMAGFVWILERWGLNLTSYALPLSGTLSAFLLGLAQQWINLQPVTSDPFILMALNIAVVVISGLGGLYLIARRQSIL